MSKMIERVAQALAEYNAPNFPLERYETETQDSFRRKARVVIEAMREPTDEQRNAYYELSGKTEVMMDAHWERAIDAALR